MYVISQFIYILLSISSEMAIDVQICISIFVDVDGNADFREFIIRLYRLVFKRRERVKVCNIVYAVLYT